MVSHALYSHALTAAVAILLTSGIWLTAYFAGVKPSKITNYNTYILPPQNVTAQNGTSPNSPVNASNCPNITPAPEKCGDTCEFVICESIPAGLSFDPKYPIFNKTTDCWMRLMAEAQHDMILGSYYWSLLVQDTGDGYTNDTTGGTAQDGLKIYNTLLATANRGVNIQIAQTYEKGGYPETTNLAAQSNGRIQVRSLDFTQWYPGGILHTKSWGVDGKHFYVGSANFDWRSLTQVKELGIAAFNCPCLADDLGRLLEIYWQMGAPGAKIPQVWPSNYSTPANFQSPTSVPTSTTNEAVFFSASPPGFQACGREDDLTAMIKLLDEATEYVNLAVMDYTPCTLYLKDNNFWYPQLDDAIRRAAFDRKVKVRFMMSRWPHTYHEFYSYLWSLQDLSGELPCQHNSNGTCVKYGSIEVRLIQVPAMQYADIPYARVYHNKYFVTEKAAYVGTSNWTPDYWLYTAGIGIIIRSDDVTQKSHLVGQLNEVFMRDWNSNYTIPLTAFDPSGKSTNGTRTYGDF